MSYLDRTRDPRRRNVAIVSVAAVHALIGYALVTGLAQDFIRPVQGPLIGTFIPDPPTPTPTPEPTSSQKPDPKNDEIVAPRPPLPSPNDSRVTVTEFDPDKPIDTTVIRVPIPDPLPSPLPSATATPRAAVPKGDPGRWVLTDDYPSRDIREGNEGTTRFRVVIGSNGKVNACEVTGSSGHPGLDEATCRAVTRRAKFEPATDGNGRSVVGTYSSSVRWVLPR